jgi:hypothetical protein
LALLGAWSVNSLNSSARMICQLEGLTGSSHLTVSPRCGQATSRPSAAGWELVGLGRSWSRRLDDLATFARYGLITPEGHCLPWPFAMQRRMKRAKKGGWQYFNYQPARQHLLQPRAARTPTASGVVFSAEAQTLCDLIGCNLDPQPKFLHTHDQKPRQEEN